MGRCSVLRLRGLNPGLRGKGARAARPAHGLLGPGTLPPGQAPLTAGAVQRAGVHLQRHGKDQKQPLHCARPGSRPVREAVSRSTWCRGLAERHSQCRVRAETAVREAVARSLPPQL